MFCVSKIIQQVEYKKMLLFSAKRINQQLKCAEIKCSCKMRSDLRWIFITAEVTKGTCQKRFSGIRPLRGVPPPPTPLNGRSVWKKEGFFLAERGGTPPPPPLTENQCEKKKVFFLNGIGGYPPPLYGKSVWKKKGFFLSGKGGSPPPLNGQNPLRRFWKVPLLV